MKESILLKDVKVLKGKKGKLKMFVADGYAQ